MSAFISDILGHRSELRRLLEDERTHLPLLLLFALLLFCAGLGLRDPWPADEPRFALIARDMVLRGDWLIPHVGGVPYSDKPPLFMWIVACFYWLSGHLRIAFLLPSMLAGLGMLVLVYDLARRLWNPQVAFHAGLLLLLTIQFTLQARTAQLDGLLSFWVTLAIYGLLRHILLGPHWAWYYIAWFAMGLGIITKGVGFLPVLLLFPWIVLRLKWPHHLASREGQPWRLALGPVAMLFAIGLWLIPLLVYVSLENSAGLAAYRDDILFRQTAERYLDSWDHIEPFWYYVVEVIPWAWLPVSLALPWLITRWWRRMAEGDAVTWLLVGWVVCVIVFFSFSPGKRGVYLLPAVPALVLAAAPYLSELSRHRGVHLLSLLLVAAVATTAVAALVLAYLIFPERALELTVKYGFSPWALVSAIALLSLGVAAIGWRGNGVLALALLIVGLWQLQGWWAYPLLNPSRSASELMPLTLEHVPANAELGLVGWKEQFLLQVNRPVSHFGFRRDRQEELQDAVAWLGRGENRRLMIAERHMLPCLDPSAATSVAFRHRREWMVAGPDAITGQCKVGDQPTRLWNLGTTDVGNNGP